MALIGLALVVLGLASSIASVSPTTVTLTPRPDENDENVALLSHAEATSTQIKINNLTLDVMLAANPVAQARGLSGHPGLGPLEGMLFIFDRDSQPGFWMKDMNFPLDIVWVDANRRIVEVSKNIAPDTYPQQFTPITPIRYVLEVNAGFTDMHNIQPGNIIHFLNPNL